MRPAQGERQAGGPLWGLPAGEGATGLGMGPGVTDHCVTAEKRGLILRYRPPHEARVYSKRLCNAALPK